MWGVYPSTLTYARFGKEYIPMPRPSSHHARDAERPSAYARPCSWGAGGAVADALSGAAAAAAAAEVAATMMDDDVMRSEAGGRVGLDACRFGEGVRMEIEID